MDYRTMLDAEDHASDDAASGRRANPIAWCYCNGGFVPESEARISIFDHAVLYGDGVFDTVVAVQGRLFRLMDHIERLFRSMAAIGLASPVSRDELISLTRQAVNRNKLSDAYVKWVVTRGSNGTPLMDPAGCQPNLIILVRPYIRKYPTQGSNGFTLKTTALRRPSGVILDPQIKSLNYLNLVLAKLEAKAAGADDALLLDLDGRVCEAAGYNIFIVRGTELATPRSSILRGITRACVFEIAAQTGRSALECDLELYDVYTAVEMFLTSTAGGLVPVVKVDGRTIGNGRPGAVFEEFSQAYRDMMAAEQWGVPLHVD